MYLLKGINLKKLFRELPAHRALNIIDQIFVEEALLGEEGLDSLHKARARLDHVYDNIEDAIGDENQELPPEEDLYDTDSMDEEYLKKAQKLRTNEKTTLKYVQPTENGFEGLGPPIS